MIYRITKIKQKPLLTCLSEEYNTFSGVNNSVCKIETGITKIIGKNTRFDDDFNLYRVTKCCYTITFRTHYKALQNPILFPVTDSGCLQTKRVTPGDDSFRKIVFTQRTGYLSADACLALKGAGKKEFHYIFPVLVKIVAVAQYHVSIAAEAVQKRCRYAR
jgi:hypothetical protein